MKIQLELASAENNAPVRRLLRICRDHHVAVEAPVWNNNYICQLELDIAALTDNLLSAIASLLNDEESFRDFDFKAA